MQKAEDGVALNHEVLGNLEEIVGRVQKVSEVIGEIAVASDHQQVGVEQLNIAVGQLNDITQQTAASSEEAASATETLSEQATMMRGLVNTFHLSGAQQDVPQLAGRTVGTAVPVPGAPPQLALGEARRGDVLDATQAMPSDPELEVFGV